MFLNKAGNKLLFLMLFLFSQVLYAQITNIDGNSFYFDMPNDGRLNMFDAKDEIRREVHRRGYEYYTIIEPDSYKGPDIRRGMLRFTVIIHTPRNSDRFWHEIARGLILLSVFDNAMDRRHGWNDPWRGPHSRHSAPGRMPPPPPKRVPAPPPRR